MMCKQMGDQHRRSAERDLADEGSMGGLSDLGDAVGSPLHVDRAFKNQSADIGQPTCSWQPFDEAHVQICFKRSQPPADRRMIDLQISVLRRTWCRRAPRR